MEELLISQIKNLSIPGKLLPVEEIWNDIIARDPDITLSVSQKKELDSRIASYKKNPGKCLNWQDAKKRIKMIKIL
jgi:putative addiction module component (TIGR02574 family)